MRETKEHESKESEDGGLGFFFIPLCMFTMLHCCFRTLGYTGTRLHKYESMEQMSEIYELKE